MGASDPWAEATPTLTTQSSSKRTPKCCSVTRRKQPNSWSLVCAHVLREKFCRNSVAWRTDANTEICGRNTRLSHSWQEPRYSRLLPFERRPDGKVFGVASCNLLIVWSLPRRY